MTQCGVNFSTLIPPALFILLLAAGACSSLSDDILRRGGLYGVKTLGGPYPEILLDQSCQIDYAFYYKILNSDHDDLTKFLKLKLIPTEKIKDNTPWPEQLKAVSNDGNSTLFKARFSLEECGEYYVKFFYKEHYIFPSHRIILAKVLEGRRPPNKTQTEIWSTETFAEKVNLGKNGPENSIETARYKINTKTGIKIPCIDRKFDLSSQAAGVVSWAALIDDGTNRKMDFITNYKMLVPWPDKKGSIVIQPSLAPLAAKLELKLFCYQPVKGDPDKNKTTPTTTYKIFSKTHITVYPINMIGIETADLKKFDTSQWMKKKLHVYLNIFSGRSRLPIPCEGGEKNLNWAGKSDVGIISDCDGARKPDICSAQQNLFLNNLRLTDAKTYTCKGRTRIRTVLTAKESIPFFDEAKTKPQKRQLKAVGKGPVEIRYNFLPYEFNATSTYFEKNGMKLSEQGRFKIITETYQPSAILTFQNPKCEDSGAYTIVSRNDVSSIVATTFLRVYEKPRLAYQVVQVDRNTKSKKFRLDVNVTVCNLYFKYYGLEIEWNIEEFQQPTAQKVKQRRPVTEPFFTLGPFQNSVIDCNDKKRYHLKLKYKDIYGTTRMKPAESEIEIDKTIFCGASSQRQEQAGTHIWVLPLILAVFLLILLIIILLWFIARNRPHTYPVDKNERKHGNEPEKEARSEYEFTPFIPQRDYPVVAEQPHNTDSAAGYLGYESPDGSERNSFDEDDVRAYHEDGSFIGPYSRLIPNENQAARKSTFI